MGAAGQYPVPAAQPPLSTVGFTLFTSKAVQCTCLSWSLGAGGGLLLM